MSALTMRAGLILLGLTATLGTAGCFRHTVDVGGGARHAPVVYDRWEHFWVAGLIGHVRVDVEGLCPSGQATIEARQSFLNGLVTGLTSGIYAPTTVRVRCHDGRRAALELSAEDVRRAVGHDSFRALVAAEMPEHLADLDAASVAQRP
ncbi:MAG: Bor family protein [Longimicrobiales bacterium]